MNVKKKLLGFLAILALTVGLMPAVAFAGTSSLTIEATDQGRDLQLYQIFTGTYDANSNVLSDVDWSSQVTDSAAFISKLKADATLSQNANITKLTASSSAADVAEALQGVSSDSEAAIAFANVAGEYFTEKGVAPQKTLSAGTENTVAGAKTFAYTFDGLDDGYYLVKDVSDDKDMNSRYIMYVAGNARADLKAVSRPTSDKKMTAVAKSDGTKRDLAFATETNVGIGDVVTYEVTSTIPNMTGYRHYQYVMNDTMTKGLTYNDDVQVVFDKGGNNEKPLVKDTDYTVKQTTNDDGSTTVNIIFKDFLNNYKDHAGKSFTYTYTATVNNDAKAGAVGENNEANLTYSNNPDSTHEGDPDEPGDDDVVGETPKQRTYVYTTEVAIIKTDENGQELKGAEFKLTGTNLISKVLVGKETFVEDPDGAYYKLKDGTYTTTAPKADGSTNAKYESTTTKYKATVVLEEKNSPAGTISATVDDAGHVVFRGLVAGDYILEETKAPAGYNKINDKMNFTIKWARPATENNPEHKCTWTLTKNNASIIQTDDANKGVFYLKVKNSKGASLPSTGGIGTTIFYVVGATIVIGAFALLITKRRMRSHK